MNELKVTRKIRNELDRLILFARHDRGIINVLIKKDILKILSNIHPEFKKSYEKCFLEYVEYLKKPKLTTFGGIRYAHRVRDLETLREMFSLRDYSLMKSFIPKNGYVVLDAGAGIGEYSLVAANLVGDSGKVIGIEPNKESYLYLKRNVKLNRAKNVIPINAAVSSKGGKIKIFSVPGTSVVDSISHDMAGTKRFYLTNAVTIDNVVKKYCLKNLDMIKLDVEGAEFLALMGARNSLKTFRPKIMIELHSEKLSCQVETFLRNLNYTIELKRVKCSSPYISLIYANYYRR